MIVPVLPLVEIRGLGKSYGRQRALDAIDLDVAPGAVTAIIGPNAAGKTTLNKVLLGLVHPDRGTIRFDGEEITGRIAHRNRIGYMPQAARFPDNFSARDVLTLLGDLRGTSRPRDETLINALALGAFMDKPTRMLSGGQRQRLNAAAAFLFTPDLLLLDEPTAGLDPIASGILKDRIRQVRQDGRAVVITSHLLSELEEVADTVVFLLDGRLRWTGPLATLLRTTGAPTLERAIAHVMRGDAMSADAGLPVGVASDHGRSRVERVPSAEVG